MTDAIWRFRSQGCTPLSRSSASSAVGILRRLAYISWKYPDSTWIMVLNITFCEALVSSLVHLADLSTDKVSISELERSIGSSTRDRMTTCGVREQRHPRNRVYVCNL